MGGLDCSLKAVYTIEKLGMNLSKNRSRTDHFVEKQSTLHGATGAYVV